MIDWNKRNGGFLSSESVYEDQLSNLSMQMNEKDKQLDKYKNVIDKLKKIINNHVIIETRGKGEISPYAITTRELEELLEEVE